MNKIHRRKRARIKLLTKFCSVVALLIFSCVLMASCERKRPTPPQANPVIPKESRLEISSELKVGQSYVYIVTDKITGREFLVFAKPGFDGGVAMAEIRPKPGVRD